ncbi:MAG: MipA/OmpV family protein [Desulfobacterales bacterium]|jgi:outer membrane scaffolding protein for murein synthesis (MipA/OmpV family)
MKNQRRFTGLLVALLAILLVVPVAQAADYSIGGGVGIKPDYEGSSDYEMVPVPTGAAKFDNGMFVKLFGLNLRANLIPSNFWRLGPMYNYRAERDDVDNNKVDDLKDVSDAHELGIWGGIDWQGWFLLFDFLADTGNAHEGWTAKLAGGYNWAISEEFVFTMGASTTYADDDYMQTYFGVDAADSRRSGLDEYDADDSIKDVALDLGANWRFAQRWDLRGVLQVKQLVGDADDDSPVVDEGSETQLFTAVLVVFNF